MKRRDSKYISVDAGEEFRKSHTTAYPEGDTPTMTIGSASLARSFLLKNGGSGFLPERLIKKEIEFRQLHVVSGAPQFSRNVYLVVNNDAATNWPWLSEVMIDLL